MRSGKTLLRFALVGAFVATVYIFLYVAFLALNLVQPVANGAAFLIAVTVQYFGQAGVTFEAKLGDAAQIARFVLMIALGLATSALITGWAGPALGLAPWLAALAVTIILPVQNFLVMSRWVFVAPRPNRDQTT